MKKLSLLLIVTVAISCLVTPQFARSACTYDATVLNIDPDEDYPVEITYKYSRRRNATREAGLGEGVYLSGLSVGQTVQWQALAGDKAVIVGPVSDPPAPPSTPGAGASGIKRVTVTVEAEGGETLTYELSDSDWCVEDECLVVKASMDVSELLEPVPEKTVMFVTHLEMDSIELIRPYLDDARFSVLKWNYMFPDFSIWGDYFNYRSSDAEVRAELAEFKELGFCNILYVDVSESHRSVSHRFGECVLESGDWWSLMTLDPSKAWYQYLKAGMLGLTERFPEIDGFAIDRLDRCYIAQETAWAAQLLDEVREEADIPVKYVMNSLQPWQTELAGRAYIIGSDGVPTGEPGLSQAINDYGRLAEYTEYKRFYINPFMDLSDGELVDGFEAILAGHDFVFLDDYKLRLIDEIFPVKP
ncbi:hypothetical protein JXL21_12855 [Candidatus Bathyarchaeota archaeon]|nr:hypothetical protein [Candidatus Bathyarchaeota archaeon]